MLEFTVVHPLYLVFTFFQDPTFFPSEKHELMNICENQGWKKFTFVVYRPLQAMAVILIWLDQEFPPENFLQL